MAQTVKLRRSSVAGNIPTTTQLDLGEVAINTADGKIYFERSGSDITVQAILTTNTTTPITGSLNMSGSIIVTGSVILNGTELSSVDNSIPMAIALG